MARVPASTLALVLVLASCGPAQVGDGAAGASASDDPAPRSEVTAAPTSDPASRTDPEETPPPSRDSSALVTFGGDGDATTVSDPFTTDGTLRGFVAEGAPTGVDRSQVVLWLTEAGTTGTDGTTIPAGCTGVHGEPPDLEVEDEAADASDGCVLLQILEFEPGTGPAGGLGEPIPAGTWQVWAVPYGPVPSWRVTYRSCQDTVDAAPSLFAADATSGELCRDG